MDKLAQLIAEELARWNDPRLLQAIFQSADPETIVEIINAFCSVRGSLSREGLILIADAKRGEY